MPRPAPTTRAAGPVLLAAVAALLLGACTSGEDEGRSAETTIVESDLPSGPARATTSTSEARPTTTRSPGSTTTTDRPTSHLCKVLPPGPLGSIIAAVDVQDIGVLIQVEDEDDSCRYTGRGGVELNLVMLDLSAGPAGGYGDVEDYLARRRAEGGEVEELSYAGADVVFFERSARVLAAVKGTRVFTLDVVFVPDSPYNKPDTGDDEAETMLRAALEALLERI